MLASMGTGQWLFLATVAVLAFWMVGAYNRLVAMRSAIGEAARQVDELVQRRAAAADALAVQTRLLLASETGALDAWLVAHAGARKATDALRQRPVRATLAAAASTAEAALAAGTARVLALLEQQVPAAEALVPAHTSGAVTVHLATLNEAQARLGFARQVFNEAAEHYNRAATEIPTRWLARLYGFEQAGRL